jgi:hypothetical protein
MGNSPQDISPHGQFDLLHLFSLVISLETSRVRGESPLHHLGFSAEFLHNAVLEISILLLFLNKPVNAK